MNAVSEAGSPEDFDALWARAQENIALLPPADQQIARERLKLPGQVYGRASSQEVHRLLWDLLRRYAN